MRKLFVSVETEKDHGWTQGQFGFSNIDEKDYTLTTHYLKSDEVPNVMNDSKTATEFIAGLLNAYFNRIDVSKTSVEKICDMGVDDPARTGVFDHPNQKEIEF